MKKLLMTAALVWFLTGPAVAGILTNDGKVDWDSNYYGIDLSIVDDVFFRTVANDYTEIIIFTRKEGLKVPEYFNWLNTHIRSEITTVPDGAPAELVDGKIRFSTLFMFQDRLDMSVVGCQGNFELKQNEFMIGQTGPKNSRGVEVLALGELSKPKTIPCMGTSIGFKNFNGIPYLRVSVKFPPEKNNEYIELVVSINTLRPLSSDGAAFDKALDEADDMTMPTELPDKLFSSQ